MYHISLQNKDCLVCFKACMQVNTDIYSMEWNNDGTYYHSHPHEHQTGSITNNSTDF